VRLGGAVLAALISLWADAVAAQQLDFKRVSRSGDELLGYRWKDSAKHDYTVAFTLTRDAIKEAEASFREFSMDAMWRTLEADLRDEVEKFGNGARIDLKRNIDGLHWTLKARDQKEADLLSQKVSGRLERAQQAYLKTYLRRMVGEHRVMVDFAAAASAMQSPLRAVAKALGDVPDIANEDRAKIALALGFFQEIPYAVLEDKQRRGGDFLPGPALLAQNRGDCDSKAVALAAVLKNFTRFRKLVVVTMPGHAILAVDLPSQEGDWTVRSGGRQYVALEVSGPVMAPIGRVGNITSKYLRDAREIEIWPLN
jgi:hypothetical protein